MSGASLAPSANFTLIAYAAKLTAASFLILISEPLATGFTVAVICASNEKAHASTDATEITVFIPMRTILPPGKLRWKQPGFGYGSRCYNPTLQVCDSIKPNFSSLEGM
jgi:hypothetical protein